MPEVTILGENGTSNTEQRQDDDKFDNNYNKIHKTKQQKLFIESTTTTKKNNKHNKNNTDDEEEGEEERKAEREKRMKTERCAGCGEEITDRYLLSVVDKQWHLTCLVCSACKLPLNPEVTCFAKDDEIFCKEDYYRKFATRLCSCCQYPITADELVMRVRENIFHLHCFVCSVCSKQLTTGEHFGYSNTDNLLFCRLHYEHYHMQHHPDDDFLCLHPDDQYTHDPPRSPLLPPPHSMHIHPLNLPPMEFSHPNSHSGRHLLSLAIDQSLSLFGGALCCEAANPSTGMCYIHPLPPISHQHSHLDSSGHQGGNLQKGRPRKRKNVMSGVEHFVPSLGNEMGQEEAMLQHQRQKRMRTSFKHHQLRIMKSYFALNHNPDSKDLKQLAQKTGLSKRVLQVWFQNARAKHRRTAIKDRDKQQPTSHQVDTKSDKNALSDSMGESCGLMSPPGHQPSGLSMKPLNENRNHHHPLIGDRQLTNDKPPISYSKHQNQGNPHSQFGDHFSTQHHHHTYIHLNERSDSNNRPPSALSDVSSSSLAGFRSSFLHDDCQVSNFADIFTSSLKEMSSC